MANCPNGRPSIGPCRHFHWFDDSTRCDHKDCVHRGKSRDCWNLSYEPGNDIPEDELKTSGRSRFDILKGAQQADSSSSQLT